MKKLTNWWNHLPVSSQLIYAAITILAIMVVYAVSIFQLTTNYTTSGQFGDQFGAVNTFFSAMAFITIIITINQTLKDRQKEELEKRKENFENKFFLRLKKLDHIIRNTNKNIQVNLFKDPEDIKKFSGSEYFLKVYFDISSLNDILSFQSFDEHRSFSTFVENFKQNYGDVVLLRYPDFWEKHKKNSDSNFCHELFKELSVLVIPDCHQAYLMYNRLLKSLINEYDYRVKLNKFESITELNDEFTEYAELINDVINDQGRLLFLYLILSDYKYGENFLKNNFIIYLIYNDIEVSKFLSKGHKEKLEKITSP